MMHGQRNVESVPHGMKMWKNWRWFGQYIGSFGLV